MNDLPEIRDIHIPDGVSLFPLAYGWWLTPCVLFFVMLVIYLILRQIRRSKKRYALKQLQNISSENPISATVTISNIMRRACALINRQAAVLSDKEWVDFLNTHSKKKLSKESADLLCFAPFMDKNSKQYTSQAAEELKTFCIHWIGENL